MPKRRSKGFANPAQTWDARYSTDDYIFGTAPNAWLTQHRDLLAPGSRVLAVADGEGRNSVWLAQQGNFHAANRVPYTWQLLVCWPVWLGPPD